MNRISKPINAIVAALVTFLLVFSAFAPSSINFFMEKAFADTPVFNGVYIIKSSATGRNICIDIPGSSKDDGKYAQSWGINYTTAQQFRITTDSDGYSTIKNVNSNLYLTGQNGSRKDIVQKSQSNGDDQKFKITSDGYIRLKIDENLVFDIKDKKDNDGQHIQTYTQTGNWNQKWSFLVMENSSTPSVSTADSAKTITYKNYKERQNVNFIDINDGRSEPINTKLADALYKGAVEKDIDKWASLAYSVFGNCPKKDERDYQITIFDDYGGNGWDQDFGNRSMLYPRLNGSFVANSDYSEGSGLKFGSSLSSAGSNLFSMIENTIGRHGIKANGYKDAVKLTGLDDTSSRDIIYTNAVCCWREGGTFKYHYNGFGLAFYDFKVSLLTSEDDTNTSGAVYPYTTYLNDGQNGFTSTSSDGGCYSTDVYNNQTEDVYEEISSGTSWSKSASSTTSYEESVEYGNDIGIQINFGDAIGGGTIGSGEGSADSAVNLSYDFTYNEAYTKGYSDSEDKSLSKSYDSVTSFLVPAHTLIKAYQSSVNDTLEETCNTPVAITYKVMMYSCNGEVYDDGVATSYTGTEGYDADSMSISFGDAQGTSTYGDANYDLYTRARIMKDASYDGKQGNIQTYSRYHQDKCIEGIDWNKVLKTTAVPGSSWSSETACNYICNNYPMSYDGATIAYNQETTKVELPYAVPLYPIGEIRVANLNESDKQIEVGDSLCLSSLDLECFDNPGSGGGPSAKYYGFDKYNGYWKIVDSNGNVIDNPATAEIVKDPVTLDQSLVAKSEGEVYVKYFINEEENATTGAYPYVTADGVVSKNNDITSKGIKIIITKFDPTVDVASVEVNGSAQVNLNEPSNLNTLDGLEVSVCNQNGKELDVLPEWEAKELESKGIKVEKDGTIICSKTGTFHVGAYANNCHSDWVEITCVEASEQPVLTEQRAAVSAANFATVEATAAAEAAVQQTQDASQQDSAESSASQSVQAASPAPATPQVATAPSVDKASVSGISQDLLNIAFAAFEKAQQNLASGGSANISGSAPTVSNVTDNGNRSFNAIVNGQKVTVTQESAMAKMTQAGISVEDIYCIMLIYDIGKHNGSIPQEKVNQMEMALDILFTPEQRSQNMANAYAYGRAAGLI